MSYQSDCELFATVKDNLFTAVVGDVLDSMGRTHQFLSPQVRPLADSMRIAGRAMTVQERDWETDLVDNPSDKEIFGLMLEALDSLQDGDVYICTGASPTYALWGENMNTRAIKLGAAGAVVEGYSRDTKAIFHMGLPVFSWGGYAQDQKFRGRVVNYRCRIILNNNVVVNPGDLVFGDLDGVIIVPHDIEEEVIDAALKRVHSENLVHRALLGGLSASEAFGQYGVM